ncbi:MAG: site-specific integrase [Campylobacterales bacterium]|nr:site-specific integrase [Campylobacterales bacterium]
MPKYISSKKFTGVKYSPLQDGDKSYYITYKYNNATKQVYIGKESEGINEQFCHQKRNELVNKIRFGDDTPLIKGKKKNVTTLNQLAESFFADKQLHNRENKRVNARYDMHIGQDLGHMDAEEITLTDIEKLQKKLYQMGKAPKTINLVVDLVKAIFNHAIKRGIFKKENPSKNITNLKVDNARERYLTKKEVQLLIKQVSLDEDLLLFTRLSLCTGGRLSTIMKITKKDLDLHNDIVTLKNVKNNNTYRGFIDMSTKKLLEVVFTRYKANDPIIQMPERTLQRKMQKILNMLFNENIANNDTKNKVVIHTLRHTFASLLAINGTPIFTIQKLLDHKDISDTLRYAKLAPDTGKEAVKNLFG